MGSNRTGTSERECDPGSPLFLRCCVCVCVHVWACAQVCNLWTSRSIFSAPDSLPVHAASVDHTQISENSSITSVFYHLIFNVNVGVRLSLISFPVVATEVISFRLVITGETIELCYCALKVDGIKILRLI